jgi:hypothetical protein
VVTERGTFRRHFFGPLRRKRAVAAGELAIDHRRSQVAFRAVVGRLRGRLLQTPQQMPPLFDQPVPELRLFRFRWRAVEQTFHLTSQVQHLRTPVRHRELVAAVACVDDLL